MTVFCAACKTPDGIRIRDCIGRLATSREETDFAVVDAFQGRHPAEVGPFSFWQFVGHVDKLARALAR